jgi:hypothetical protein
MRKSLSRVDPVECRCAREAVAGRAVERREGSVRLSGQLGLGAIPAGAYTLRIEVRDAKRGQTAAQTAEFGVGKS